MEAAEPVLGGEGAVDERIHRAAPPAWVAWGKEVLDCLAMLVGGMTWSSIAALSTRSASAPVKNGLVLTFPEHNHTRFNDPTAPGSRTDADNESQRNKGGV